MRSHIQQHEVLALARAVDGLEPGMRVTIAMRDDGGYIINLEPDPAA